MLIGDCGRDRHLRRRASPISRSDAGPALLEALVQSPAGSALQHFWAAGWGFDWLYDRVLVRPFLWFARTDQADVIDRFYSGIACAEPS